MFKHHPSVIKYFENGQRVGYGKRTSIYSSGCKHGESLTDFTRVGVWVVSSLSQTTIERTTPHVYVGLELT